MTIDKNKLQQQRNLQQELHRKHQHKQDLGQFQLN